eukprot:CCRYP_016448-RB/>CCRYP_016448-RB protein AED:0.33 eAED:0.33 QI:0/0/0/1/0/0/2/0/138
MKIFTDHKNLIQDALGTSDHVYCGGYYLRSVIPKLYTSKVSIIQLLMTSLGPIQDDYANWMSFTKCRCHYTKHATRAERFHDHQEEINMVFTNCSNKDVIYPLTVKDISQAQTKGAEWKKLSKHAKNSTQLVEDTQLL